MIISPARNFGAAPFGQGVSPSFAPTNHFTLELFPRRPVGQVSRARRIGAVFRFLRDSNGTSRINLSMRTWTLIAGGRKPPIARENNRFLKLTNLGSARGVLRDVVYYLQVEASHTGRPSLARLVPYTG